MKKVLFLLLMFVAMTACNNEQYKYGQGGKNACQFVNEKIVSQSDNIKSIEVIAEDSLLSDIGLTFATIRASNIKAAYFADLIPYSEMSRVLDSCKAELMYVEQSWRYGTVSKKLKKFEYQWRKVYTVRVTMKSTITKETRVLMDQDGITPRMLEMDFFDELRQHQIDFTY